MHWSQLAAGHQDARCERGTRPILSSHTAYHIQSILNPIIQANNPANLSISLEKLTFKNVPTLHGHIRNGTLGVTHVRDVALLINKLLKLPFKWNSATSDFHPRDHISFASQHPGEEPFDLVHTIYKPEISGKDDA
jgi:hypothetical protein